MGRVRVGWFSGWVNRVYINSNWVISFNKEKKHPRGTLVPSMVLLLTREAQPAFPSRDHFLRSQALNGWRWSRWGGKEGDRVRLQR